MAGILARRRTLLIGAASGLGLAACSKGDTGGADVIATEDLMREHGLIRRLIVIYREAAASIAANASGFDAGPLGQAATLFQRFAEDYHELKLEEQHVFPQVLKAGGEAASMAPVLIAQHARGRQITGYIRSTCAGGKVGSGAAAPLVGALLSFARMYEAHAAWEDTILFPAWKATLSPGAFREMSERFEEIERNTFAGDGFDIAAVEVSRIEQAMGLHDLARFTAPAPSG
jgi:hemerythrin-like domain-containing protein